MKLTFTEGLPSYDEVEEYADYVLMVKDYRYHNYVYLTVSASLFEKQHQVKWWFSYKDDYLDDELVDRVVAYCKLPKVEFTNQKELEEKYNKLEDANKN